MGDKKITKDCDSETDICQLIDTETEKRCCDFHEYFPGCIQCEVTPITLRAMVPAIISFFILVVLLIYAMVGIFPKYFS